MPHRQDDFDDDSTLGMESMPSLRTYNIPKKNKKKEVLTQVPLEGREATQLKKEIIDSLWESQAYNMEFLQIELINNDKLEKKYAQKRSEMKDQSRSDVTDSFAYVRLDSMRHKKQQNDIFENGLSTKTQNHYLPPSRSCCIGDDKYGIYLCRCADVLSRVKTLDQIAAEQCTILVCKYMKGRLKSIQNQPNSLEPSPDYDGHLSQHFQHGKKLAQTKIYDFSQLYLYEIDLDNMTADADSMYATQPRQCIPYATVTFKAVRKQFVQPVVPLPPLVSNVNGQNSTTSEVSEAPSFNYGSYLRQMHLIWKGFYHNQKRRLGEISIGMFSQNPERCPPIEGSNMLYITQQIRFEEISKIFPQKIFRKPPCISRKPSDEHNGFRYVHAEIQPVQGSSSFFIDKLHKGWIKNKTAGICTFKDGWKLFLLPTGELTDRLGITLPNYPPIIHCIFMRRLVDEESVLSGSTYEKYIKLHKRYLYIKLQQIEEIKRNNKPSDATAKNPCAYNEVECAKIRKSLTDMFLAVQRLKTVATHRPPAASSPVRSLPTGIVRQFTSNEDNPIPINENTTQPTTTPLPNNSQLDENTKENSETKIKEEIVVEKKPAGEIFVLSSDDEDNDELVIVESSEEASTPQKQLPLTPQKQLPLTLLKILSTPSLKESPNIIDRGLTIEQTKSYCCEDPQCLHDQTSSKTQENNTTSIPVEGIRQIQHKLFNNGTFNVLNSLQSTNNESTIESSPENPIVIGEKQAEVIEIPTGIERAEVIEIPTEIVASKTKTSIEVVALEHPPATSLNNQPSDGVISRDTDMVLSEDEIGLVTSGAPTNVVDPMQFLYGEMRKLDSGQPIQFQDLTNIEGLEVISKSITALREKKATTKEIISSTRDVRSDSLAPGESRDVTPKDNMKSNHKTSSKNNNSSRPSKRDYHHSSRSPLSRSRHKSRDKRSHSRDRRSHSRDRRSHSRDKRSRSRSRSRHGSSEKQQRNTSDEDKADKVRKLKKQMDLLNKMSMMSKDTQALLPSAKESDPKVEKRLEGAKSQKVEKIAPISQSGSMNTGYKSFVKGGNLAMSSPRKSWLEAAEERCRSSGDELSGPEDWIKRADHRIKQNPSVVSEKDVCFEVENVSATPSPTLIKDYRLIQLESEGMKEAGKNDTSANVMQVTATKQITAATTTMKNQIAVNSTKSTAVAVNITKSNAVAVNSTKSNAVAVNSTKSNAVAVNSTKYNAVNSTKYNAVYSTESNAVAVNITKSNAVAVNSTKYNAVYSTEPNAVAVNSTKSNAVAVNSTKSNAVYSTESNAVAVNSTKSNAVAENSTKSNAVAVNSTKSFTATSTVTKTSASLTNVSTKTLTPFTSASIPPLVAVTSKSSKLITAPITPLSATSTSVVTPASTAVISTLPNGIKRLSPHLTPSVAVLHQEVSNKKQKSSTRNPSVPPLHKVKGKAVKVDDNVKKPLASIVNQKTPQRAADKHSLSSLARKINNSSSKQTMSDITSHAPTTCPPNQKVFSPAVIHSNKTHITNPLTQKAHTLEEWASDISLPELDNFCSNLINEIKSLK